MRGATLIAIVVFGFLTIGWLSKISKQIDTLPASAMEGGRG